MVVDRDTPLVKIAIGFNVLETPPEKPPPEIAVPTVYLTAPYLFVVVIIPTSRYSTFIYIAKEGCLKTLYPLTVTAVVVAIVTCVWPEVGVPVTHTPACPLKSVFEHCVIPQPKKALSMAVYMATNAAELFAWLSRKEIVLV